MGVSSLEHIAWRDARRVRSLNGFGGYASADAFVWQPGAVEEICEVVSTTEGPIVLRGAGRSYNDAALMPEARALDLTTMNRILDWDPNTGMLLAEAGTSLRRIAEFALAQGFWLPVVSGTARTTVGGAVASNIHGKNNWKDGTFADHLAWIDVVWPSGERERLSPESADYWSVVGGLGLGAITVGAAVRLRRVRSGRVRVVRLAVDGWRDQFDSFQEFAESADYMVSWVDGFGNGRGVFEAAWHVHSDDLASLDPALQFAQPRTLSHLAQRQLKFALARPFARALAAARYGASRLRGGSSYKTLAEYHFPLDAWTNWETIYRPGALLQLQMALPAAAAKGVFAGWLARAQAERMEPTLVVLKRHRPDQATLPYLLDGYSLALDFRVGSWNQGALTAMLRTMMAEGLEAGGRLYFAKDALATADMAERSLGASAVEKFREFLNRRDPHRRLQSALGHRSGLLNGRAVSDV
jgi:FAD/FMN-containing dehydrogenase